MGQIEIFASWSHLRDESGDRAGGGSNSRNFQRLLTSRLWSVHRSLLRRSMGLGQALCVHWQPPTTGTAAAVSSARAPGARAGRGSLEPASLGVPCSLVLLRLRLGIVSLCS